MSEFGRLLEAHIPSLRRYARALTHDATRADDLVQDCLERALAKQHLWHNGTNLRGWLFTLLHHQYINEVRRALRESVAIEAMTVSPTVPPDAAASLRLRDLERAIAALPREQRMVILLVGLEEMRYEAVATILGIPIGTVRSRVSRGRDTLRTLLDVDNGGSAGLALVDDTA
jgi:RNA polymerase sigma-70 factor (ECF subfamily)